MANRGRPSLYSPELVLKAVDLAYAGKTDAQIASSLEIGLTTLLRWKEEHPDFRSALKKAKDISDDQVEATLRERAMGYSHKAVKFFYDAKRGEVISQEYTEHYPPDVTACIFWLKNRRPELWRDRPKDEQNEFAGKTLNELIQLVKPKIKELEAG